MGENQSSGAMRRLPTDEEDNRCLRCGALLVWLHETWQCVACKWKQGCCD